MGHRRFPRARPAAPARTCDQAKLLTTQPHNQLLAGKKSPGSAGWFMWGSDDSGIKPGQQQLYAAAQLAGMDVQQWESVGTSHDWLTPERSLATAMPWVASRSNLTD